MKQFDSFKVQINADIRDFERRMKESQDEVNKIDEDMRDMIEQKERSLLVKIDEIRHNQEKVIEKLNRLDDDDDGDSVAPSTRVVTAAVIAQPIAVAAPASSNNPSEIRSSSPSGGKKSRGISQEQLNGVYDSINQVQISLVQKINDIEKLRSHLSKEVKELQRQM